MAKAEFANAACATAKFAKAKFAKAKLAKAKVAQAQFAQAKLAKAKSAKATCSQHKSSKARCARIFAPVPGSDKKTTQTQDDQNPHRMGNKNQVNLNTMSTEWLLHVLSSCSQCKDTVEK